MAADSAVMLGWNRAHAGKEKAAIELFGVSMAFYAKQQAEGNIESFEPVMLGAHGGDLNGFVLIRGQRAKLDAMVASDEFQDILVRGQLLIDGLGVIQGFIGDGLQKLLARIHKHA